MFIVASNATRGLCNTQIDLFTITTCFDHYFGHHQVITIRSSFQLQANLPIWAHIYNVNIFTIY
jgi:hypothetical protein